MHPGLIAEALRTPDLHVQGHVTVAIYDERGKCINVVDAPNYINTAQWQRLARWAQKNYWWQGLVPTGGVTKRTNDGRDPRIQPRLSNDVIACWNDGTLEDSTDVFTFGEVTAYAHRWEQGSPATRQGVVNPSLCTLTDDTVSWVWEWTTSNGNGTFQSVGWRRLLSTTTPGDIPMYTRRCIDFSSLATVFSGVTATHTFTSGGSVSNNGLCYDKNGNFYASGTFVNSPFGQTFVSIPITVDSYGNYTLGAMNNLTAGAVGTALTAAGMGKMTGLCVVGTDVVGCGGSSNSNSATAGRRPIIRRVTSAGVTSWTNVNAATYSVESTFVDVTWDGSNLWVTAVNGSAGTNAIHRITPSTGAISSSINSITGTPAYFPAWSATIHPTGLEWDSGNGWFWVADNAGNLYNCDTSGVWGGVLLSAVASYSVLPTVTLSGAYNTIQTRWAKGDMFDAEPGGGIVGAVGSLLTGGTTVGTTHPWSLNLQARTDEVSVPSTVSYARVVEMLGECWVTHPATGESGVQNVAPYCFTEEPCFSTRSLLPSAVSKNSGQTMRLKYDITFT